MRRAARTDKNQSDIVKAFRKMGCSVQDLSSIGSGCPDILVGISGINILCEIKNDETRGKLNAIQEKWHGEWRGQVLVVKSVDHAIRIVNWIRDSQSNHKGKPL